MIGRGLLLAAAFSTLAAAACGKKPAGHDAESAGGTRTGSGASSATDAASTSPPTLDASSKGTAMVTDFVPYNAFRDHAVKVLQTTPDGLEGGAIDAETAKTMPNSIGGAWAYTMFLKANPPRDVRGWVTEDGTVITPDQNLGILFKEAGAWEKTPTVSAKVLADTLTWSYGMGHKVELAPENGMFAPKLQVTDGKGTFRFFTSFHEAGPGGAGGGMPTYTENVVTLTADGKATLERKPYAIP